MNIPQCIHIPDGSVVVSGELFDQACAAIAERDGLVAEIERLQRELRRANAALVRHGVQQMIPGNHPGNDPEPNRGSQGAGETMPVAEPVSRSASTTSEPRTGHICGTPDAMCDTECMERAYRPLLVTNGIKCTHCDGKGIETQHYDEEQGGWSDPDVPCATCEGTGRIRTVEQYLKTLPANWHEDSSLYTWFPLTAEEHERYKRCLYRANGRLMKLGQEPEKLDYPQSIVLKSESHT